MTASTMPVKMVLVARMALLDTTASVTLALRVPFVRSKSVRILYKLAVDTVSHNTHY